MTELGAETNAQEWCDYSKGNVKYAGGTLSNLQRKGSLGGHIE